MAVSIRCFPAMSDWPTCRPADHCGYSRSTPNRVSRMMKASLVAAAAYLAAAAITASAQTATPAATTPPNAGSDQAQIDEGKVTFAQKCSHCHGFNMVNAGTIALFVVRKPAQVGRDGAGVDHVEAVAVRALLSKGYLALINLRLI